MADVETYWWSNMDREERAKYFKYASPEAYLAAMAEHGELIKCTDPATLARVAKITVEANQANPAA